jgi:hypothetical protein
MTLARPKQDFSGPEEMAWAVIPSTLGSIHSSASGIITAIGVWIPDLSISSSLADLVF